MTQCINCQVETTNPKFCSRSCNASYNNRISPRRKKNPILHICPKCNKQMGRLRKENSVCRDCYRRLPVDMTLKEATYLVHHRSSAFALIRTRARAVGKAQGFTCCSICGYDKHFEVSHIKAIKDFSEDTLVSVINHPSNLRPLCPNCHWEIDHKKVGN